MAIRVNRSDKSDEAQSIIIPWDWRVQCETTYTEKKQSPGEEFPEPNEEEIRYVLINPEQKKSLGIPIPNPSAIYLSLAFKAKVEAKKILPVLDKDIQNGYEFKTLSNGYEFRTLPKEKEAYLFNRIEQLVSCLIFSYTAIEAFANESIPENYHFEQLRKDKKCQEIYSKDQIERFIKLDTKLDEILPTIYSLASPKGGILWNNFIWLEELRDRFIHLKTTDWAVMTYDKGALNHIWINLLSEETLKTPLYALELIRYYLQKNEPRWLRMIPIK